MFCPNCGTHWLEEDRFCRICGTVRLTEEAQPTTDPPVDSPAPLPPESTPQPPKKKHRLLRLLWLLPAVALIAAAAWLGYARLTRQTTADGVFYVQLGMLYFNSDAYNGSSELTVPETIGSQQVTAISPGCFEDCDDLTTVILPATVTQIGAEAFLSCDSLRGIFIPESVTYIGREAFADCAALEAICIPATVTRIGEDAFSDCEKLRHIFFSGPGTYWVSLYNQPINDLVTVYASDGKYVPNAP